MKEPEGGSRESGKDAGPPSARSSGPPAPTPVRDLMAGSGRDVPPPEPELRSVEIGDETWHVSVGGRQRTGTAPDSGASLLLLFFQRSPDDETPAREVYVAARRLDDLHDEDFPELLERSRPWRPPREGAGEERDRPSRSRRRGRPRGG